MGCGGVCEQRVATGAMGRELGRRPRMGCSPGWVPRDSGAPKGEWARQRGRRRSGSSAVRKVGHVARWGERKLDGKNSGPRAIHAPRPAKRKKKVGPEPIFGRFGSENFGCVIVANRKFEIGFADLGIFILKSFNFGLTDCI